MPGASGSIIVTDGAPTLNVGDTILFFESTPATEGDLVEFVVNPLGLATGITLLANGTLFTGPQGDITVGLNEIVVLDNAQVNGKIETDGASMLVITGGSTISGDTEARNTATVIIAGPNTFFADVNVRNAQSLTILNNTVNDDLEVRDSANVTVTGNSITGDLEVRDSTPTPPIVSGNTVGGTTEIS